MLEIISVGAEVHVHRATERVRHDHKEIKDNILKTF